MLNGGMPPEPRGEQPVQPGVREGRLKTRSLEGAQDLDLCLSISQEAERTKLGNNTTCMCVYM